MRIDPQNSSPLIRKPWRQTWAISDHVATAHRLARISQAGLVGADQGPRGETLRVQGSSKRGARQVETDQFRVEGIPPLARIAQSCAPYRYRAKLARASLDHLVGRLPYRRDPPTIAPYLRRKIITQAAEAQHSIDIQIRESLTPFCVRETLPQRGRLDAADRCACQSRRKPSLTEVSLFEGKNSFWSRPRPETGKGPVVPITQASARNETSSARGGHCFRGPGVIVLNTSQSSRRAQMLRCEFALANTALQKWSAPGWP